MRIFRLFIFFIVLSIIIFFLYYKFFIRVDQNPKKVTVTTQPISLLTKRKALCSPNLALKIESELWIIVCGYQNSIYQTKDPFLQINHWKLIDSNLKDPHSAAYANGYLVVDNAGDQSVVLYQKSGSEFLRLHQLKDVGVRPHRTQYMSSEDVFYVLSSGTADLYKLKIKRLRGGALDQKNSHSIHKTVLTLDQIIHLDFLNNKYTRSFSIIDDKFYFISEPGFIFEVKNIDAKMKLINKYSLPKSFVSPNDIFYSGIWWYVSGTPRLLIRSKALDQFELENYENIYEQIEGKGTPYFISVVNDELYIPEVTEHSRLRKYEQNSKLHLINEIDFGF